MGRIVLNQAVIHHYLFQDNPHRRVDATLPRNQDVSLDKLDQRVHNQELKIDTLEKSIQISIQTLRDDFITKKDHISYQRQLFQAFT